MNGCLRYLYVTYTSQVLKIHNKSDHGPSLTPASLWLSVSIMSIITIQISCHAPGYIYLFGGGGRSLHCPGWTVQLLCLKKNSSDGTALCRLLHVLQILAEFCMAIFFFPLNRIFNTHLHGLCVSGHRKSKRQAKHPDTKEWF